MNYLQYIETKQVNKLFDEVFDKQLLEKGTSAYAKDLTEDEQIALIRKMLTLDAVEVDNWVVFLKLYNQHHPIAEKAADELCDNLGNNIAFSLIVDIFSVQGYTERQGIKLCRYILESQEESKVIALLQVLCDYGKEFSLEIYNYLVRIDIHICELGYPEQAVLANSYQTSMLHTLAE
ncbi:MAG: hypothetical protein IJ099_07050 [Alphaproteobacteria bacterium]|nr:hypothetical protein [Alphaproteobacteria bacterium]